MMWLLAILATPDITASQACPVREVTRDELLAAMRRHGNYDIVATTNWGRFQTEVFLRLMRWSRAREPESGTIVIQAEDWYRGYLEVAGLTDATAPEALRVSHGVGQMIHLDFRRDRVIRAVRRGREPQLAANVRVSWPSRPGVLDKYSYRDTLSVPQLKVTNHRVITYRLLDFGDMVLYDEIKGLSGRPTSGLLGTLFVLLGEGAALVELRIAIAPDDVLVVLAVSKLLFSRTVTVTVPPDGRGAKGIPAGRADLAVVEERLRQPLDFDYRPYTC